MPPKKSYSYGLRIQLKGLHSTADMRAMLNEAIDQIEAMAITHVSGTNLYLTPSDNNGSPVTPLGPGRRRISNLILSEPYRSAADEHGL